VLALDPHNTWALSLKGDVLSEFAQYEDALEVLKQAADLDSSDSGIFSTMGWVLENLGAERAAEAKQAYEKVISLKGDELWAHKGVANALELLGEAEEAASRYRCVIQQGEKRDLTGARDKSLIGWCYYKLGQYENAIRVFKETLSLDPSIYSTQFDLALSQMCHGDYSEALQNYQKTLGMISSKHPLKRRGLLYVALDDLRQAIAALPQLATVKEAQEAIKSLEIAWEQVKDIVVKSKVPNPK